MRFFCDLAYTGFFFVLVIARLLCIGTHEWVYTAWPFSKIFLGLMLQLDWVKETTTEETRGSPTSSNRPNPYVLIVVFWPFMPFFRQLCLHFSNNWGSDGDFEVLNKSKSFIGSRVITQSLVEVVDDDSLISSFVVSLDRVQVWSVNTKIRVAWKLWLRRALELHSWECGISK